MTRVLLALLCINCVLPAASAQNYQYYSGGMSAAPSANSFSSGMYAAGQSQNYSHAQRPQNSPSLEQMLDAVDTNQAWSRTPVSAAAQPQARPQSQSQMQLPMQARNQQGMTPRISRKEMARVFFEGGSPQPSGGAFGGGFGAAPPANNDAAASNAYSNYKTAMNEETKAREAANRARYNTDSWVRKNSASQAEYAARNADYAAQRAQSAAYNGGQQAQGYANLARQCANRARQNANQARYNADTIK